MPNKYTKWMMGTIVLIVGLLIVSVTQLGEDELEVLSGTRPNIKGDAVISQEVELVNVSEQPITINPVSLPALFVKKFDGQDFKVGQVLSEFDEYTRYYITYRSGELLISGIMNVPKGNGPYPVLLLNHRYIDPAIYTNGRGLKREQDYLAKAGYVVIHSDYRNHADSDNDLENELSLRLGYTEDVINVLEAVRKAELPYVNIDRVGILGHSMGGGIALNMVVSKPELAQAVVLFAPINVDARENFIRWIEPRGGLARQIIDKYGDFENNPKFWDEISPVRFIDRIKTPIMIHHGSTDDDIPIEWSNMLVEELKNNNKNVNYFVYPNEPHEFEDAWPTVMKRTKEFFDKNLKQ